MHYHLTTWIADHCQRDPAFMVPFKTVCQAFRLWQPAGWPRRQPHPGYTALMTHSFLTHLDCSRCDRTYDADRPAGLCECGSPLLAMTQNGRDMNEAGRQD